MSKQKAVSHEWFPILQRGAGRNCCKNAILPHIISHHISARLPASCDSVKIACFQLWSSQGYKEEVSNRPYMYIPKARTQETHCEWSHWWDSSTNYIKHTNDRSLPSWAAHPSTIFACYLGCEIYMGCEIFSGVRILTNKFPTPTHRHNLGKSPKKWSDFKWVNSCVTSPYRTMGGLPVRASNGQQCPFSVPPPLTCLKFV